MKKLSFVSSYINQDAYTFIFYFHRLSCSHTSHSLRYRSLELSTSSLTLRQRAHPFLSGRCPFFRSLYLGILFPRYPTSHHFGTQHKFTHPPVKSSTLPLRNMLVSQGVLLDILFSYCPALTLFDLVLTHITH